MKAIILTKSPMKAHGASGVCTTAYDLDSEKLFRFVINEEGGPITPPYNNRYRKLQHLVLESQNAIKEENR